MYNDYFGFREAPFSIAPDPRYLFMSERHREALAHLLYGVSSDGGFVLLTGEVGTGKTTVCRGLLEQLPKDVDVALVLNPKLSALELLATICDELRIDYPDGSSGSKVLVDRINSCLLAAHGRGRKTVLIIDEAQNLSPETLEQIRLLTNLETNQRKLLQIILLGQPELRELLRRPELRQLAQRITARYHLGPLSRSELNVYVEHRLAVAGVDRQLFPPAVVAQLYRLSRGVPRVVNLLCDRALLGTYVQGRSSVNRATLVQAAREVFGRTSIPGAGRWRPIWPLAAMVAVGSVLAVCVVFFPGGGEFAGAPRAVEAVAVAAQPQAVVSPVSSPASSQLQPPPGLSAAQGQSAAFQALFERWGLAGDAVSDDPCAIAGEEGLECLPQRGSLGSLRRINLPAVLRLFDQAGGEFFASLLWLGSEAATLVVGGQEITVSLAELEQRWLGEFIVLWRRPAGFERDLGPGDRGQGVLWLERQLAAVQGRPPRLLAEPVLAGDLLREVEDFQRSRGLLPDGIVGPYTLIHLQTAVQGGPVLCERRDAAAAP